MTTGRGEEKLSSPTSDNKNKKKMREDSGKEKEERDHKYLISEAPFVSRSSRERAAKEDGNKSTFFCLCFYLLALWLLFVFVVVFLLLLCETL